MTWSFRLRFNLSETTQLTLSSPAWVVAVGNERPRVVLSPADNATSIGEARILELRGTGFLTEEKAAEEGARWQDWLMLAFAENNISADFGARAPQSHFSPEGLTFFGGTSEKPLLPDVHGLMTFRSAPTPDFIRMGPVVGRVGRQHTQLVDALQAAISVNAVLSDGDRLAYDLYAASSSESNADARFILLMMALETLIEQQPRDRETRAVVNTLMKITNDSNIDASQKHSLISSLQWLHEESIGQAGRRLAKYLGDKQYNGQNPSTFFSGCYEMRSSLVHGHESRPSRAAVDLKAAMLEVFVADLIVQRWRTRTALTDQ